MERNSLDSLLKRKKIVQSLREHSQNRRWSLQKTHLEQQLENGCTSFNHDSSSNQSNDIIENSDTDTEPMNVSKSIKNKANITINMSSDINTSTISLPLSNSSFFGDDVGNLIPPNSPFKNNTSNDKKINIISCDIIKHANTKNSEINNEYCAAVSLNSLPPVKSIDNNLLPADNIIVFTEPPETSYIAKKSPPLDLNVIPADNIIVFTEPPETSYIATKSPPLDLNVIPASFYSARSEDYYPKSPIQLLSSTNLELGSSHANSYTTQPKASNAEPYVETSFLNLLPNTKQPSPSLEEIQPGPSNTCQSLPVDNTVDVTQESPKIRNKRTRPIPSFKKSCMDFLPEEEVLDFSAGSSDDWTCNESESSSEFCKKKKKKLNKKKVINKDDTSDKRKKEKKNNQRKERKILKDAGKAYKNEKGDIVKEKSMGPNPCEAEKCKRGCYEITENRRESLFNFFWSLDPQRRKDWLINSSRVIPVSRKRTDSPMSRRSLTYEYFINNGEDHQKVCQKFILKTLDLTQKYLLYNLSHSKEGMSQNDLRTRTKPDKYSPEAKEQAKSFIEKLPAIPSHYCRKKSKKVYLPQDLKNVTNLYRIYKKECENNGKEAVGESVFKKIFNDEYNISFHVPKKDKCLLCTRAERNDIMNEEDKENLENHIREKKSTYQRFITHQNFKRPENDTLTTSFDLQKVLTTPHGDSMLLGYARKYAVFNFTLYESGTQNVYCYIWGECDGKRGSQEIASCLYKYFQEVDNRNKVSHLILYCDSCPGQNKNKVVLAVINFFLKTSKNVKTIQINYLLPGHTYMPVDSVHATIEREIQKLTVWSPSQWAPYISSARKRPRPYEVIVMDNTDFINWEELASKTFTKGTLQKMQFKNIRIATFKKQTAHQVEIKYSTDENSLVEHVTLFNEPGNELNIKGKGKRTGTGKGTGKGKGPGNGKGTGKDSCLKEKNDNGDIQHQEFNFMLRKLYNSRLPISVAKFKDLKHLCDIGVIPRPYHSEFLQLPHSKKTEDTLDETDEEDEVNED